VPHRPRQRQRLPAAEPSDNITQVTKKKASHNPPRRKPSLEQQPQACKVPSFSEFYNYSLVVEGNSGDDGGGRANGDKNEVEEDRSEKQCVGWNIEALSQATSELCALSCRRQRGRCSGQSASTQQFHDDTSADYDGFKTSTPHLLSSVKMSAMICHELSECTSQLQLFDADNGSVFGMFECSVRCSMYHEMVCVCVCVILVCHILAYNPALLL